MIPAERTELQSIANRIEERLRAGLRSAEEMFQTTQDQINALGGAGAINFDGSTVFSGPGIENWMSDYPADQPPSEGSARWHLQQIRDHFETARDVMAAAVAMGDTATGYIGALDALSSAIESLVGTIGSLETVAAAPTNTILWNLERILDLSKDVLGNVNLESNAMWFQIGPNSMQGMILQLQGIHTGILGGGHGDLSMLIDVREGSGIPISRQLDFIDIAEGIVNGQRAQLGAVQNRLEFTRQSLDISSENLSAAESRIRDTDMAREMMRFTAAQVLQQAGISMLAQANQLPSSILQLLQ
jgi:flagellin-like hook-associated protein FlgL